MLTRGTASSLMAAMSGDGGVDNSGVADGKGSNDVKFDDNL